MGTAITAAITSIRRAVRTLEKVRLEFTQAWYQHYWVVCDKGFRRSEQVVGHGDTGNFLPSKRRWAVDTPTIRTVVCFLAAWKAESI